MEPQIGIRGRGEMVPDYDTIGLFQMEPQIGIRGKASSGRTSTMTSTGFNGAPDRNPGKANFAMGSGGRGLSESVWGRWQKHSVTARVFRRVGRYRAQR